MNTKNTVRISLFKKIRKIDIKAGDMTFGQRIELGKIFSGKDTEVVKFQKVFECLHSFTPMLPDYKKLFEYFNEIISGIKHWVNVESSVLKYEPTLREEASFQAINNKDLGNETAKAIAKNFNTDKEAVLSWQYKVVYKILLEDCEKRNYRNNLTMNN